MLGAYRPSSPILPVYVELIMRTYIATIILDGFHLLWRTLRGRSYLSRRSAQQAGSFLYFVPIVTVVIAWVWLKEKPSAMTLIGGVLILCGVLLVNIPATRINRNQNNALATPTNTSQISRCVMP